MEQSDLALLVEYIYCGEVRVAQDRLDSVMAVAEVLGIRGLLKAETSSPCKKRRLYEESQSQSPSPGESQRPVITSNGGGASPAVARTQRLSVSAAPSASRGAGADLDNFNDIRPDILEMIKEEQKVGLNKNPSTCHSQIFSGQTVGTKH